MQNVVMLGVARMSVVALIVEGVRPFNQKVSGSFYLTVQSVGRVFNSRCGRPQHLKRHTA
jgi:hypothetical protein